MNTITRYQVRDDQGNTYGTYVLRELAEEAIQRYQDCPISNNRQYTIKEMDTLPKRYESWAALVKAF